MKEVRVDICRVINSNFSDKVGCAKKAEIGRKFCLILFPVFELVPSHNVGITVTTERFFPTQLAT